MKKSNYIIGRGRPPKASQWKPGQSGNPHGRPKGSKNFKALLREHLEREVVIVENGKNKKISMSEFIIRRFINEAAKGNIRMLQLLLQIIEDYVPDNDPTPVDTRNMSQHELAEHYKRMIQKSIP